MKNKILVYLLVPLSLLGILPMLGIWVCGLDVRQYLEFPPLTRYVGHQGFSWGIFVLFSIIDSVLLICMMVLIIKCIEASSTKVKAAKKHRPGSKFPWWAWTGLLVLSFSWVVAWHRFNWAVSIQKHTFIGLWMGYILVVNGLCIIRTKNCPMIEHRRRFGFLFPFSAIFWWVFEYLNRYVQNWYYLGIEDFSAVAYAAFATLSFSTVLPAVYSTYYLILSFFHQDQPVNHSNNIVQWEPVWLWAILSISAASLFLMGILPNMLFPVLWISPLLLIGAIESLFGKSKYFMSIFSGDMRMVLAAASAALICGIFWEMWNFYSLAKWEYAISYVNVLHIFEMPLLGYGGYLPFGLECVLICHIILDPQ